MTDKKLTQEILLELLEYNPTTGDLVWKQRDRKWFLTDKAYGMWNTRYAGTPALDYYQNKEREKYKRGNIFNKKYLKSRVVWFLFYGEWPNVIDHIDGNTLNDSISNLRSVSYSQNSRNMKRFSCNTSGYVGINWCKQTGKWKVRICQKHLGRFDNLDEAIRVRQQAELEYQFHKNHGRIK